MPWNCPEDCPLCRQDSIDEQEDLVDDDFNEDEDYD
jgi:hypothetical protein